MESYQQFARIQCPVCDCHTETVGRRGLTTLHRCPKCLLEIDHLDPRRRAEPLDTTDLRHKPVTEAPSRPPRPKAPQIGEQGHAVCRRCGSGNLFELSLDLTPHYSITRCRDCGLYVKFSPRKWTLARAQAFALPFGKHRGCKFGELAKTAVGRSYLAWVAKNLSGNPGTAARIALANDPVQPPGIPDRRSAGRRQT
jgi:uncharacterized protein (DUF983 family)